MAEHSHRLRSVGFLQQTGHNAYVLRWAIAAWMALAACAIWSLAWKLAVAMWPYHEAWAVISGAILFGMGLLVAALAVEVFGQK